MILSHCKQAQRSVICSLLSLQHSAMHCFFEYILPNLHLLILIFVNFMSKYYLFWVRDLLHELSKQNRSFYPIIFVSGACQTSLWILGSLALIGKVIKRKLCKVFTVSLCMIYASRVCLASFIERKYVSRNWLLKGKSLFISSSIFTYVHEIRWWN